MNGLLALAFTAGLVSPVNPCGFALLPAWLAYHLDTATATTAEPPGPAGRLGGGLRAGLAVTAGYAGTLTATGLLVTAGARPLLSLAPWLALAVGGLTRLLRRGLPILHRATGAIMLAAGAYLIAYWLPATRGHTPGRGLPNLAPLAGCVSGWIQTHQAPLAALTGLTVTTALVVTVIARRRRGRSATDRRAAAQATDTTTRPTREDPQPSSGEHARTDDQPSSPTCPRSAARSDLT